MKSDSAVVNLTNGPKPADYQQFVDRIESLQQDKDIIDARAKEDKAPINQDIAEIYDEAEEAGISKKALKHVVRKRRTLLKAHQAFEKLDISDRSDAVTIEDALGPFITTELGQAAASQR